MPKLVFVLGCERSGSTWVANALDAHPHCDVFLEPVASVTGMFPGIPDRFSYVEYPAHSSMVDIMRQGLLQLADRKYPYFYRWGRHLGWKRLDLAYGNVQAGLARLAAKRPPLSLIQYRRLNLHSSETPLHLQTRKVNPRQCMVVKELRLNFKFNLLRLAFPGAKYVIVVRHPGAQVSSVDRLFRAGHLQELKQSLHDLPHEIERCGRLNEYQPLLSRLRGAVDSYEALLVWWLINYDVLIQDCRRAELPHLVLFHEDLAKNPLLEFARVYDFLGLDLTREAEHYLIASSTDVAARHTPLSTMRDSAAYASQSIRQVKPEIVEKMRSLFRDFAVGEPLMRYDPAGLAS